MTRRREVEKHRHSLDEIRGIMNAMKNLSYMETRKISGFLDVQHTVVEHIESVATDFLTFYPDSLAENTRQPVAVYLMIGAERGFCGDFNHALLRHFKTMPVTDESHQLRIIAIGHKLQTLMENDDRHIIPVEGASVAEEVDAVLNRIVGHLASIQKQFGSLNCYVLYHNDELQLVEQQLLPPFQNLRSQPPREPGPPLLNLHPRKFLPDLGYHYLFVLLYEILYSSLMAECRRRMAHLEGAIQHMEAQSEALRRKDNVLRQEEIIEEIEVILLSAVSLDEQ